MLRPGEIVGPYQIVEELGSGGMATVYKAYHERLDRHVAIKVMHESLLQEANFMSRFEREAQIIANLEHPNIVPVYDFDEYQGKPYLVMKLVQGRTLEQLLQAGPLSLSEILRIMGAVAEALTYAHEEGVLHRDIKPSNIVLDEKNVPYLTDFGLARLAQQGSSSMSQGAMIGTPHYISPEQALGQGELDARTDVYSLGVVLYELVVGRVPFIGDTPFSIVHDHIYTPLPPPAAINPEVPPQVEEVLVRALAKDPDARYPTATDMIAAFRRAVDAAGLSELNPDRVSVASESLARFQQEKVQSVSAGASAPKVPPVQPAARIQAPAPPSPPAVPPAVASIGAKIGEALDIDFSDLDNIGPQIEARVKQVVSAVQKEFKGEEEPLTAEERIRQQVEERIKARNELITHLVIYIATNGFLWVVYGLLAGLGGICAFPWVLIVMFGWGIGVVANLLEYYNKHGAGALRREQEIAQALEQARRRGQLAGVDESFVIDKLKNEDLDDRRVRLTDDGEFSESFVQEIDDKPKRGRL